MDLYSISQQINNHINNSSPDVVKFAEVYTGLELVEEILSILPNDYWSNPYLKILDPCNGIGNFPSIIIKKLMIGLIEFEPDENRRYKYIIENIIYTIELQTSNVSIYKNIFDANNVYNMNIYSGSFLEIDIKKEFNIDEFDLIVGNPPYQYGSDSRSSISIYNKFVDKSHNISKKVLMITPSKWYTNPGMLNFRYNMINNYGLKILIDKGDVFKSVDIKGGVSFFLLEKDYKGECLYNNNYVKFDNLITNSDDNILINKIKDHDMFSNYMLSDQYFKIRNKDERFLDEDNESRIKCYVSSKNGNVKYVESNTLKITNNHNRYKVFIPTASGSKHNIGTLGRLIIGYPNEVSSRSFVHFSFNSLIECESFISYINTDIIKKLISIKKQTHLVKKDTFSLVPIIPLDRICNNEKVKIYFNI